MLYWNYSGEEAKGQIEVGRNLPVEDKSLCLSNYGSEICSKV